VTSSGAGAVAVRQRRFAAVGRPSLLIVPATLAIAVLYLWPLVVMGLRSFTDPSVGLGNYQEFVNSPLGVRSFLTTMISAVLTTIACVAVGYPYSYLMAKASTRWAAVLGAIVLVPTGVSFLVRSFALQTLLWDTGVINSTLIHSGLIDAPLPLIRNQASVIFAMTSVLLPLFVLPAYAVMRSIDGDLERAAAVLGASPVRRFLRIFLPLSFPGVAAGALLVFVIALGYYIIPAIFGDGRTLYLGEMVVYYTKKLDWGFSSAISVILLVATLAVLAVASRVVGLRDVFGVGTET
jgi:ABC-type spermidine/putrescine transport system permease subunit I